MGKLLNDSQVEAFQSNGVHFPVDIMSPQEMTEMRARLERIEGDNGGKLGRLNHKPHLVFPWLNELIRHPRILDAVEDLYGPNLLCWGAQFFTKQPGDASFVSWHQDATYWGLSSPDVVTAWVAFTPSIPENGCMRVVPGTHRQAVRHEDTFAQNNLLTRGQEIPVHDVDASRALDVVLQPGQMSLHHVMIIHGSEPNASADLRRVGFAIRYIPTHVRQTSPVRDSATLVRGVDEFGHFDLERAPRTDLDPEGLAQQKEVIDRQMKILYAGAAQQGRRAQSQPAAR